MANRIVTVLALVLTGLMLAPFGAHLFALPNKIGMPQDQYLVAQSIYRGWALFGLVMIPAVAIDALYASLLRHRRGAFALALAASVCMAATLVVFFVWTYPANVATQNWTIAPDNWSAWRTQWEYSHAANAVLTFTAFVLLVLATIARR